MTTQKAAEFIFADDKGWSEVGVLHAACYWHSMNFTRAGTNWKSIPRAILFFMRAATELFSRRFCSILATWALRKRSKVPTPEIPLPSRLSSWRCKRMPGWRGKFYLP